MLQVNNKNVIDVVLMFLLLILNILHIFSYCFYCWLWTSNFTTYRWSVFFVNFEHI